MMANKLLLVVDMQNDFVTGSLGTDQAREILPRVCQKVREYLQEGNPVAFTLDTHGPDYLQTQEGRHLPVEHCIRGTWGWQLCDSLEELVDPSHHRIYEKNAFGSADLARDLEQGAYSHLEQVELVGVCTDICVVSNALLFKTFLPELPVVVDAACCAGVTPESHQKALDTMAMCQVEIR